MWYKIYRYLYPQQPIERITEKYNIPAKINFRIHFNQTGWIVLTSPDFPGLITQARNGEELLDMANDAVLTYFDVPKKEADYIFDHIDIEGQGTISYKKKLQTA